jgi:DNA-binding XRE family transcriptional regulator
MDKRYNAITMQEQLRLRQHAVDEVLANPQWTLAQAFAHLKRAMRLTTAEYAKLSGVSLRTLQDIEGGRSEGTVVTMNKIFGVLGLKLGVVQVGADVGARQD